LILEQEEAADMGFFKKIFKGIKKVFKKIGKGIKSAFKSIGKFMGKIGIIGQIGLALVLPGVGQVLSGMLVGTTPGVVGGLAGTLQGMGAVGQAASSFIQGAVKIASNTGKFFSSITDGVAQVVGDTIGAAAKNLGITTDSFIGKGLNNIGINVDESGWGKIFTNAQESFGNITEAGRSIFDVSQPVGDPTATALAQDQMGNISQVSEGLQGQIEGGMTTPDIPAPVVEQPSLLTPEMPRPVVTTTTSGPPTVLESIQAGSYTTDATGTIVPKSSIQAEKSLLDKASEFVTGRDFETNVELGRAGVGDVIAGAPKEVAKGVLSQGMQALGLEDELQYNVVQNTFAPPALDMGSMTSIGQELSMGQPEQFFTAYRGEMASNPYGATANFFNIYPEYMQRALG